MRKILITGLALSLLFIRTVVGQPLLPDSNARQIALANTIQTYHTFIGVQARVYNGIEHVPYPPLVKGQPYFVSDSIREGSVVYDGVLYTNILMEYDLVRDQLIVRNKSGNYISPPQGRIERFNLDGHEFFHTPNGYYDLLATGKITLVAKRIKQLVESIVTLQVTYSIEERNRYYRLEGGVYHPIHNRKALFALFGDKKKEVRQYLRRNNIRMRNNWEELLLRSTRYFNQISL